MRRVAMLVVAGVLGFSCVATAAPRVGAPPPALSSVPAWQPLPPWATSLVRQLQLGWAHPHAFAVPVPGPLFPRPAVPRVRGYTCFVVQPGDPCDRPAHPLPIALP